MIGNRGGSGRPRKPLALKIAGGDPSRVGMKKLARMAAEEDAQFVPGEPRMPDYLSDAARKEWSRLVPLLLRGRGVLSEADGHALGTLCQEIAVLGEAHMLVEREGLRIQNGDVVKAHPLLPLIHQVSARVAAGLREFGMTPASRARVMVAPHDGDMEDLAAILSRPRKA